MKRLLQYLLSFSIVVLIIIGIRSLCISSYYISTNSMQETVSKGDYVLVNKIKSKKNNPGRNRVVLFKNPIPGSIYSPSLFISRCIGMPGDTIQISREGYILNGKLVPNSPTKENIYRIRKDIKRPIKDLLQNLQIPYRDAAEDSFSLSIRLTPKEEITLRENLPELFQMDLIREDNGNYIFVIPEKGRKYPMDPTSLILYKDAILAEKNAAVTFRDGGIFKNGKEINHYIFKQNYYWMLSDNEEEAIDSRHLGLIPEKAVIGNIWLCWFSKNKERAFKYIH